MIERGHPQISVRQQCELIGLSRSSLYYQAAGESECNLRLMHLIDRQYTRTPFYGWPRMTVHLRREGHEVNAKRIRRLMALMGLQAIQPKRKTSIPAPGHKRYPYLLSGLKIMHPCQVWSTDITYVPMRNGFMFLVAILDWFSRYVLAWQLSNTLDGLFCRVALRQALGRGVPAIFNSDQGAQFTAVEFTSILETASIRISMDGRGRALDNVFVERLWRTVKYEHIYLMDYAYVPDLAAGLHSYFEFYNKERPHQSLGYRTPAEVHYA
jgi:putative transposase